MNRKQNQQKFYGLHRRSCVVPDDRRWPSTIESRSWKINKKICDQFEMWRADDDMSASIWRGNDRCDQHGSNILHFKHLPPSEIFFYSFSYRSIWGDVSICAYSMRITRTKIEHIFNCVFCWVSISPIGRHKSENSNRKSVFIYFSF